MRLTKKQIEPYRQDGYLITDAPFPKPHASLP
jgi:hypothetical protein